MNCRRLAFLLSTLLILGPAARLSRAVELRGVLTDYSLSTWGLSEGLPASVVWAIVQDLEGYLWLGTDAGPVRFDGVRFATSEELGLPAPAKGPVRALLSARDGSIWFGYAGQGGVTRLHKGRVQHYGPNEGLDPIAVTLLFEHPAGVVWAGNERGLYRLESDRWQRSDEGVPATPVYHAHVDTAGRFLVSTAMGVFRRNPGQSRFEPAGVLSEPVRGLGEDSSGTVWVSDEVVGFRELHQRRAFTHSIDDQARGSRLLYDRHGNLWVGTFGRGLWRVRADPRSRVQTIEKTTALTSFTVMSLMEDREGNLWVGTADGLNRLTPYKVTPISDLGSVRGVEASPDGSIWVGTFDALFRFRNGDVRDRVEPEHLSAPLAAMHVDNRGTLWVATEAGLLRFDNGRRSTVRLPAGHSARNINFISSGLQDRVLFQDVELGLFQFDGAQFTPLSLPLHLRQVKLSAVHVDRSDRIWLVFENGWVGAVDTAGTQHFYDPEERLDAGVPQSIYQDRSGIIWFGGTGGLSRFADGQFTTLHTAEGFPIGPVTGIVEDDLSDLWVAIEGAAIVQVRRIELQRALSDPSHRLRYNVYDKSDGLAGTPRSFDDNPSVTRGRDGRLWFVGGRGVTVVDPRSLPAERAVPARVRIEGAYIDDRRVEALQETELSPRTSRLEIQYAVLNLTAPFKTRFRHRLQGFDDQWIEAGTRREAFYTNLPPRQYQFQVIASNDDGTWTDPGAVWSFTIAPMFYQTTWFAVVSVVTVVVGVAAAWYLHLRQVRRRFALLLGERARLSREIHDTLLQSLVGVALQFDAMASDIDSSIPPRKDDFVRMRKTVEEYIREARQSIWDLRSPKLRSADLVTALQDAGEHATSGLPVEFEMTVTGTPRRWSDKAEEQLLRIGQEAILNAVRHADAKRVRVELAYSDESVVLRVLDDGRGFDPELVAEIEGHYGLVGMRERAKVTGGEVRIWSSIGRGTEVEAVVPAAAQS
ncbi:MAG TPA: two-component regulator propeller domain-containing protein [Vicinamibacterales bacterium]|nr:two-component regulator propeller domain-containing protein [Vicinamibacterales bacterium]